MNHHGHHSHWGQQSHAWRQRHHGWGRGGMRVFPFFGLLPLFFGLAVLFFIFKTGLWIPLLLIGAFVFFAASRKMSGWCDTNRGEWDGMREKMKNEWRQWQDGRDGDIITPEKPKRTGDSEFV